MEVPLWCESHPESEWPYPRTRSLQIQISQLSAPMTHKHVALGMPFLTKVGHGSVIHRVLFAKQTKTHPLPLHLCSKSTKARQNNALAASSTFSAISEGAATLWSSSNSLQSSNILVNLSIFTNFTQKIRTPSLASKKTNVHQSGGWR